ncbi:SDR family NAD(P)-dependent oxidoreductase [Labrys wisconsinensis]|uniref:Short-subunit dehydrogenase n=1 Tax=Labrys wisconsinensis TaxID=425677 RepID=A0ABU0J490_9HYPH|nr:SDR family NAD(P)-dependent oxidoreductase [Labrys wisconsinensis]MDQ0469086.1 short-subunit dehydrogenase [Labrys wisconsinensis]
MRPSPKPATPQDGIVWITGASSGIGRAVAMAHARRGWTVAVTARREGELARLSQEAAAAGGRIVAHPGDVTDAAGMAATVAAIELAHGPIARALFNAGLYIPVRAATLDAAAYARSFEVNVIGVANGLAAALPGMLARRCGQVAITASVAGYGGLPTASAYGGSKAALINMAAGLKPDLDPAGVLIQVICPGFVRTGLTAGGAFPKPFLMNADRAALRILAGLETTRFEIAFPRRMALMVKAANLLPYRAYFALLARGAGRLRG